MTERRSRDRRRRREPASEMEEYLSSDEERADLDLIPFIDLDKLVPTSSTLLNLGLSDTPYGGFYLGTVNNIIGDSAAGKTFLLWSIFAELTYNDRFENHDLYYDEPERAFAFNIGKLFGDQVDKRIILDYLSESVEDFHDNIIKVSRKAIDVKKSFIYGFDSLDAVSDEDEIERDVRKGSYGGKKPKLVGEILRKIVNMVKSTDSSVFVISQTRDNIGVTFGSKKTRSGGKALRFFSTHELWLAVESHIKRKERDVGVNVVVKIGKNKLTGKLRVVKFPIYYDYGIDDVTSCIDFLIEEKRWSSTRGVIDTHGDFVNGRLEKVIECIESEEENKKKLIGVTASVWREIEEEIKTNRPSKYPR